MDLEASLSTPNGQEYSANGSPQESTQSPHDLVENMKAVTNTTFESVRATQFGAEVQQLADQVKPMYEAALNQVLSGEMTAELFLDLLSRNHSILVNRADIDRLTFTRNTEAMKRSLNEAIQNLDGDKVIDVYFTDIARFKAINDKFGQLAGDEVISEVGERTKKIIGNAVSGRLGGDEFLYYKVRERDQQPDIQQPQQVDKDGQTVKAPFVMDNIRAISTPEDPVSLEMHMGITTIDSHNDNALDAIKRANTELSRSKEAYYKAIHPEYEKRQG